MGNWVIVCHGGVDKDGGNVQIPQEAFIAALRMGDEG